MALGSSARAERAAVATNARARINVFFISVLTPIQRMCRAVWIQHREVCELLGRSSRLVNRTRVADRMTAPIHIRSLPFIGRSSHPLIAKDFPFIAHAFARKRIGEVK